MKCALHVHTTMSDASIEPQQAIDIYAEMGFGCVAITDHAFLLRGHYEKTIAELDKRGMIVLAGKELDHEPWQYHHLLRINGAKDVLNVMAHPAAYYLTASEINRQIKTADFNVDAIEISHRGFPTLEYDTILIKVPKIATDDAHAKDDCGRAWIEMDDAKDPDKVIAAVRAGQFKPKFFRAK